MKRICTFIIFLAFAQFCKAQDAIQYTVSFENAVHHEAFITMFIPNVPTGTLKLRMSRSSPGRYATHEFGKNVYDIHAYNNDGSEIDIKQVEGDVYEVPQHQDKVKISYTLFGNWVDGTYAGIDTRHAHLNMPATFLWAPSLQDRAMQVKFLLPAKWKVATQLKLENGFYTAPNLQYFMDSPTEIADYHLKSWEVQNPDGLRQQVNIVFHGRTNEQTLSDFESKVKKVVNEAQGVYGELPKYDDGQYRLLIDVMPGNAGDGMEHRNSTVITNRGESLEDSFDGVLGTVSHEYFHSWNVERMRPKTLEPFDFEKANMSDGLWFAEGFTQYYGNLILERANLKTEEDFIATQGAYLNSVLNSPGANKYSPIFMSQRAVFVDAGVAIDQNNNSNIFSSYYIYGDITALALDLTLRGQFGLSLDDYMSAVWKAHGKTEIAYQMEDLEKVLGEVTRSPDFARTFFSKYIYGSEKADYAKLFASAGYVFRRAQPTEAWIGNNRIIEKDGKISIGSASIIGTPLYISGLDAGDVIIKMDETEMKSVAALNEFLKNKKPGETVNVSFQRDGETLKTTLKLTNNPSLEVVSFEKLGMEITPEIKIFRKDWLGSKALN
ncbi:MAG: PDZ domain-containing protein [Pelobium sp.]